MKMIMKELVLIFENENENDLFFSWHLLYIFIEVFDFFLLVHVQIFSVNEINN